MMKPTLKRYRSVPLYESVAGKIAELVDKGTFGPGEKVPSIRRLSRQMNVSISTVKTAYGYLEDRRIIQARPQSGYYVCPRFLDLPKEPKISKPEEFNPAEISVSELVSRIMGEVMVRDLVQFGVAMPDPDLIPIKKLNRMLASSGRRFGKESIGYAMVPGNPRLRTQIAKHMMQAGCTLHPDDIIITNGASEAVFLALRALCKPGDTIVLGAPIYFNLLQLIQSLGIRILEIPMSLKNGIRLKALEMALDQHRVQACLLISNFNNPLGNSMPDDRKQLLLGILNLHKIPLIEDDINGDLSFSFHRPSVIKSWDMDGDVLLCSSFSKTLAPGYRVGWIVPGRFYDEVKRQKLVTNIASSTPTQLAIAEFLISGGYEHHLRSIRKAYAKRVAQMADALGKYFPNGTRVTRPKGGFTLWVELPETVDGIKLYGLAEQKGISIAPGRLFTTTENFNHYIRLNASLWSDKTSWAVKDLGKMVHQLM